MLQENRRFLEAYTGAHSRLDLLILNANARTRKTALTEDRIETTFVVGCLSRYMFSVALSPLLKIAEDSRVIHIGDASSVAAVDYDAISGGSLGIVRATYQSYSGDALLAYWFNESGMTEVPHEVMSPGAVKTGQLREMRFLPNFILRLLGVIEPEECGRKLVEHILSTDTSDVAGRFFQLGQEKRVGGKLKNGRCEFEKLLAFCEEVTGIRASRMV